MAVPGFPLSPVSLIERGNPAVLQTFPAEYYRGYGGGYVYRSHYGRAYCRGR